MNKKKDTTRILWDSYLVLYKTSEFEMLSQDTFYIALYDIGFSI